MERMRSNVGPAGSKLTNPAMSGMRQLNAQRQMNAGMNFHQLSERSMFGCC